MIVSLLYNVIAWIASIVIAFANLGALAEAPNAPAWNHQAYLQNLNRGALRFAPKWDITFDETLTQAFVKLEEETGMNIPQAVAGLRDMYYYHRWIVKLFPGFFYDLRDKWMDKGDYWEQNGDGSKMVMYRLLGLCVAMPTKVLIAAEPIGGIPEDITEDIIEETPEDIPEVSAEEAPGDIPEVSAEESPEEIPDNRPVEYDVVVYCTYLDGSVRRLFTYTRYNRITGEFGDEGGISNLGYNFNFNAGMAYTTSNTWQRSLGYMKLYDDILLKTTKMVNVEPQRLKFAYKGMDWMLQLWKGRYFTTTGGELGLYHKPKSRLFEFYNAVSDEERIHMSFKIITDDTAIGNPVLVDRPVTLHWWMTGFALRPRLYTPDHLTLETIVVPTDSEMYAGLVGALEREKVPYAETFWDNPETEWDDHIPALKITW